MQSKILIDVQVRNCFFRAFL